MRRYDRWDETRLDEKRHDELKRENHNKTRWEDTGLVETHIKDREENEMRWDQVRIKK